MLNWRDPWHPSAGGAEIATLRIMEHLVQHYGYSVEWFSAMYPGAMSLEERHGIRFVRAGTQLTVHLLGYLRYRKADHFDVVVDQINTIPFFTPLYQRKKTVALIYQLAREVWFYEAPVFLGWLGYCLEPLLLSPYRRVPIITASNSSKRSLRQIGLLGRIHTIPLACDERGENSATDKSPVQDIVIVSRLRPSKRIELAIKAAAILKGMGWRGKLHIAGSGAKGYIQRLQRLAHRWKLENVVFHGRVTEEHRRALYRQATLLWMTSVREGWGLVVIEAAQHWTPAVVYNVPGLCDSVINGVTGVVVNPEPISLAGETWSLLNDPERLRRYALEAKRLATSMTWGRTARSFDVIIKECVCG